MSPSVVPTPSDAAPRGRRVTLAAAEVRTGLNRRTLSRRIKDGTLRAYHVAGTRAVRVDTDDLDALFTPMVPVSGGDAGTPPPSSAGA